MSLSEDLRNSRGKLSEFVSVAKRTLVYMNEMITSRKTKGNYVISLNKHAGTERYIRPINVGLFESEPEKFDDLYQEFIKILARVKSGERDFQEQEFKTIDRCIYTIQQAYGAGFDLLVNPNAARKHVGNRFEELIRAIFTEIGISNKKQVLKIPYESDEGQKIYNCENDIILSPYNEVRSSSAHLDPAEIVVSIKSTSKDRMGKIFIDKILLERFVGHDQKVIGIFLNDVQRKNSDNISYTLVSGLFMVYSSFLTPLDGVYYLDPPPKVSKKPYSDHMFPFSKLITKDIWHLLSS